MKMKALQDLYAPKSICFGCGPKNPNGLKLKSYISSDPKIITAEFTPMKHHEAFPGILNGGIIGSLLDCHCNWTAAYFLMQNLKLNQPPCTVTAEYTIKMKHPTPTSGSIHLKAWVKELGNKSAVIEGELISDNKICATCTGVFVAVKQGHPAFHRW